MTALERYLKWRDNGVPADASYEEFAEILVQVFGFELVREMKHGFCFKHPWLAKNRDKNRGWPLLTVSNHSHRQGRVSVSGIRSTMRNVLEPMDEELGLTEPNDETEK